MNPAAFQESLAALPPWLVALGGACLALLLLWIISRVLRKLRMWRLRSGGRSAERRAIALLAQHGYRLVSEQAQLTGSYLLDGHTKTYHLRCDLLVERRGRRYLAEVKGGTQQTHPGRREVRRQLLEYQYLAQSDGVLLVNVRERRVHLVQFPGVGCLPAPRDDRA